MSLVELLVVLAIIAMLVALLLPGIQAVREAARRTHCQNNLKQISLALLEYHETHGRFPSGGWGYRWVGVPELGVGRRQPGGWIYSILPYVEQRELFELGSGTSGAAADEAYSHRVQTPLSLFVCPSRRAASMWPIAEQHSWVKTPRPHGNVQSVARADYAINGGTSHAFSFSGPADLFQGDDADFWRNAPSPTGFSGISHLRVGIPGRMVLDGMSHTYLVGEKHLAPENYTAGTSLGDNESLYAGYCSDLHRFAGMAENLSLSRSPYATPLHDDQPADSAIPGHIRFGGPHAGGFNIVHCDGSGHFVAYQVEPEVHYRAGHRSDQLLELE